MWDWNGTLVDDLEIVVAGMSAILARRSLPTLTLDRYREVFDFPVQRYYEAVGLDVAGETFETLAAEWIAENVVRWPGAELRASASQVLAAVSEAGFVQSILSATENATLASQAAQFGVAGHFVRLVGIDNHHAVSKLEHGRRWLAELGVPVGAVLLVGDTTHDVEVATALGIDVVLIEGGHQSRARLAATGAPVLPSLEAVLELAGR